MQSLPNAARRQGESTVVGVLSVRQLECLYWAQEGKSATDIASSSRFPAGPWSATSSMPVVRLGCALAFRP